MPQDRLPSQSPEQLGIASSSYLLALVAVAKKANYPRLPIWKPLGELDFGSGAR
jgi:hypothetical protein